jgi:hypothetical protein
MSFAKDGFTPGELVQMIIEVDNTNCTANINTISITVSNTVTLRSQGHGTSDHRTLFSKTINGVYAGQAFTVLFRLSRVTKPFDSSFKCQITLKLSQLVLASSFLLNTVLALG